MKTLLSQLHPIFNRSSWDWGGGPGVIRRMYVIISQTLWEVAETWSSDGSLEGYKGHTGEINVAGADNLSFFMYLGEFLKGLTLYKVDTWVCNKISWLLNIMMC